MVGFTLTSADGDVEGDDFEDKGGEMSKENEEVGSGWWQQQPR